MSWYNPIENYPCNPCGTSPVCKKNTPAYCTLYKGPVLTYIGLTTNINVELILTTIVNTMQVAKADQETKNATLLAHINDINSRIVAITGEAHAPYTL